MLTLAAILAIFVYGIIAAMLGTILPRHLQTLQHDAEAERQRPDGAGHRPDDWRLLRRPSDGDISCPLSLIVAGAMGVFC
jgi:hypothetical protein